MTIVVEWKNGKIDVFPNVVTSDREPINDWFKFNLEEQKHEIHTPYVNRITILKSEVRYEIRN